MPGESHFPHFVPHKSPHSHAIEEISEKEIAKYTGQYVAISVDPENPGILAAAPSVPALNAAMRARYSERCNYAVRKAPQE